MRSPLIFSLRATLGNVALPIWTDLTLPAKGMKATDQEGAIAAVAVGNAMVMDAALTDPRTSLRRVREAQLRSQDM